MEPDKLLFFLGAFLLLIAFKKVKMFSKIRKLFWVIGIILVLGAFFFPIDFYGKWNAVKMIGNKSVTSIILSPSQPQYEINLTDSMTVITNQNQIVHIRSLLENANVYFRGHSPSVWQTKMILKIDDNDSLFIEVDKTTNQGTALYIKEIIYRSDPLAKYLEKITNFIAAKKSIAAKTRTQ